MKKMIIVLWMLLVWVIAVSATFAAEDFGHITPANLGRAHRLYTQGPRDIWIASTHKPARIIVNNPTAAPEAEKPRLYEVNIHGFASIYIDPNADYTHQGQHQIGDENHLLVAQRLIRSMNAKPARIVRNPNRGRSTPHAVVHPQMILLKPDALLRQDQSQPRQKKIEIPMVPAPPKKKTRLMAMTQEESTGS